MTSGVGRRWQDVLAVAVPVLLIVLTIGSTLIGRSTQLSVTLLTGHMPWQAFSGWDAPGHQYCTTDTIDAILPDTAFMRDQVFNGHLPNWNPYPSGGIDSSTTNLALLSPLSLPYWVLPLKLAPAFVKLLEFIVAIGGMFLFLRRLGRSRLASSLAGVVYATSGFMVMWSFWPHTRTAAWIPALFWAIERLLQRRRLSDVVLIGAVVGSMLLSGFPSVTGYALYLAGAYLLVRVVALYRGQWRTASTTVALASGGLVLGASLAAVQLLPFARNLSNADLSRRAQNSSLHLRYDNILSTVSPNENGLCINAFMRGGGNPVETVGYVGAAALTLAVLATALLFWRRRAGGRDGAVRSYFVVAAAVIVVLCWIGGPLLGAAQNLPVFSNNYIGRIRSIFGFVVAVLVAYGIDLMLSGRRGDADDGGDGDDGDDSGAAEEPTTTVPRDEHARRRRLGLTLAWFAAVWVVVIGLAIHAAANYGSTSNLAALRVLVHHPLGVPIILIAVTLVAAVVAWIGTPLVRAGAVTLVAVLILVQNVSFFRTVLPGNTLDDFYPVTGAHRFLSAHDGHDRFDGSGGTMYPATAPYYKLRAATGHAFLSPEWADLLKAVDPKTRESATNYAFPSSVTPQVVGRSAILDRLGVKYFAFDPLFLPGADAPIAIRASGSEPIPGGGSADCTVAGRIRGVEFIEQNELSAASTKGITVEVTARNGTTTLAGARYLGAHVAAGATVTVPITGEDLPAGGRTSIEIRVRNAAGPAAVAVTGGSVVCAPVRPVDDGLKLVYSDAGTIIFQRLSALPRIRWASHAIVIPDSSAQVAALTTGVRPDTVVLGAPGSLGAGSGKPASVTVLNDSGTRITARVNAQGSGYLVVADSMQRRGWSVTVDGATSHLVDADHAFVAVPIAAGTHTVRFSYRPPGQIAGASLTALGILVSLGLLVADRRFGRRRPTAAPEESSS